MLCSKADIKQGTSKGKSAEIAPALFILFVTNVQFSSLKPLSPGVTGLNEHVH